MSRRHPGRRRFRPDWRCYFPIASWLPGYRGAHFREDLLAAVVVTVILIPQSLAYALLAGLPPEAGLYASILPLMAYTVFGTSNSLSVGPVAIISLLTATAIGRLGLVDPAQVMAAAILLAMMTGLFLILLGILRLGLLANLLSHPVISGFVAASALLIALGQIPGLFGFSAGSQNLLTLLPALATGLLDVVAMPNWPTLTVGLGTLIYLFWTRYALEPLLVRWGAAARTAAMVARASPVLAVVAGSVCAWAFDLADKGLAVVGHVPAGLRMPGLPDVPVAQWGALSGSAALIGVLIFVESISVAQGLAARRRQRIDPDQELIGLGAANVASSLAGGFPVAGGFSRSVVNFQAGAATPAAGFYAALLMIVVALLLLPYLAWLPMATLSALIITAVWSLVDISIVRKAWRYSRADFIAVVATLALTLLVGVEAGVAAGILVSVVIHFYKSARPHVAIVGAVPGTEHYRNMRRHNVMTYDHILSLRVDRSLYFVNTRYLEDVIYREVAERPDLKHVILVCSSVNEIDLSALETLELINSRLGELNVQLHLSEVKGPVMDRLQRSDFLQVLTGRVHLSQHQAMQWLLNS